MNGYGHIDPDSINLLPKIDDPQFEKDILLLEQDIDALGWDQPHALYAIMGKPGDLRLEKISDMQGHPVDWMRIAVVGSKELDLPPSGGLRQDVLGVAIANEGWKHPSSRDFERHYPEDWATFMKFADQCGVVEQEEIYKHIDNALDRIHSQIPPHANPRRMEIRSIMVLMRNGQGMGVHRTRGEDASVFEISDAGRVIQAMQAILTGCWPADPSMNEPTPERF